MGKEKKPRIEQEVRKGEALTPELAKALLETERKARIKRCSQKIERALAEEGCTLVCSFIITAQGNIPQVQIMASPGKG